MRGELLGICNIMCLSPTAEELLARARADLRMGVPIVLDGPVPIVCSAVETLDENRLGALKNVSPDIAVTITRRRAETLKTHAYDGDLARLHLPQDTPLSWVRSIADPSGDLMHPLRGPLQSMRGGDVTTYRLALGIAKSARLLPAMLCAPVSKPTAFADTHQLVCLTARDITPLLEERSPLHSVVHARLPMEVSEAGRLHVFRPDDGGEEHYAIEIGKPDRAEAVLTRLHSACFTGDLLGSLKCDCGPQLRSALALMGSEGAGVLLYMNQEGRGIGLANKMRAYSLQDQGFDTVDANHRLGFEDDERDFRLGADILKSMGFSSARLITNNPAKVRKMEDCGIAVTERVPLRVGENPHNRDYLATKVARSGHLK